eukprot:UN23130
MTYKINYIKSNLKYLINFESTNHTSKFDLITQPIFLR